MKQELSGADWRVCLRTIALIGGKIVARTSTLYLDIAMENNAVAPVVFKTPTFLQRCADCCQQINRK